ncbi:predicted protein [Arabidopsis lyrata subsp. lyrata]|uniref:Predicted protein n=1 Tax=Arabidopsis lyrata subsp. lyrata TaxID=81972 RepID=D7M5C0_ARALL|nr:predicted protein [Arabidopsis lyrata subsp. lyrata]
MGKMKKGADAPGRRNETVPTLGEEELQTLSPVVEARVEESEKNEEEENGEEENEEEEKEEEEKEEEEKKKKEMTKTEVRQVVVVEPFPESPPPMRVWRMR